MILVQKIIHKQANQNETEATHKYNIWSQIVHCHLSTGRFSPLHFHHLQSQLGFKTEPETETFQYPSNNMLRYLGTREFRQVLGRNFATGRVVICNDHLRNAGPWDLEWMI